MTLKQELLALRHPYYWINLIVCTSYLFFKRVSGACQLLFRQDDCELNGRETEILFFLISVVAIRTRRAGSVSVADYFSASFTYARLANLALWWYADIRFGIGFGILLVLLALALPRPASSCIEKLLYFRGEKDLEEEFNKDRGVVWIIAFYAAWHPACNTFAPVFAQISSQYHLENLRFGKVDVGRYPESAAKHRIIDSALSKQLPTLILFRDGKEVLRRPHPDSKNQLIKFLFSEDNIKAAFDLTGLHRDCSELLTKKKVPAVKSKDD